MKDKMNFVDWASLIVLAVGGLNWGLFGLFGFDLVAALFGEFSALSRIVYVLVGASAVYTLVFLPSKRIYPSVAECRNLLRKTKGST